MRLLMWLSKQCCKLLFGVRVSGLEHIKAAGERVLIVANHTSFLDGILIALFVPAKISFAISPEYYNQWWMALPKRAVSLFPLANDDTMAMKSLIQLVKSGAHVAIFPEGRITNTGALMKIYPGPGMIADKAGANILPIRIHGAEFSRFSRLKGKIRRSWFPKITLTILPHQSLTFPEGISNKARRAKAGEALATIMREMMFASSDYKQRLWDALLDAAFIHGKDHKIIEDMERSPLTYSDIFTRTMILQQLLPKPQYLGEHLGVLLPNVCSCYLTFFAVQAMGAVPAMLNFTMGTQATRAVLKTAAINTVFTSRKFIEMAELEDLITCIEEQATVVYLEDLRANLSIVHKLKGLVMAKFPSIGINRLIKHVEPDDAAVVLFTSGSEGVPKGVALSHQNILANIAQINASLHFDPSDICLNTLPFFHSFGLSAGSMLTTLTGIKTFFYPSPLHYRQIPEIAYDIDATIIFGTNVFLAAYAKHAAPYDFHTMRYVVAGAEKLHHETREIWMHKFGIRILEGYGATETSPVLCVNTPMYFKATTVGQFLPGIEYRLERVPGISKGGQLIVRSPNVMKGYLLADKPGIIQPPEDGWYDTGDIVDIDDQGFVSILGRAKRFAKVAGEMISLTAVEEMCCQCWPEYAHIALAFPDLHKGEHLVLMSTKQDIDRKELIHFAQQHGIIELQIPKQFLYVSEVPLLGSGKTHYVAAQALAEKLLNKLHHAG